MEQEEPKR